MTGASHLRILADNPIARALAACHSNLSRKLARCQVEVEVARERAAAYLRRLMAGPGLLTPPRLRLFSHRAPR
jgi:hypothetical protein